MKVLGVITARGGSKRLPNKNLALLGGRPLIAWSIEVGLSVCNHLVTSTDSHEIADVAARFGSKVIMRPPHLCGDADHVQVVIHAAKAAEDGPYNAVMLLQPTSPFRNEHDCRQTMVIMGDMRADSVISVVKFPHQDSIFTLGHASRLRSFREDSPVFTPNGAVYLIEYGYLVDGGDWYGSHAYAHIMPPERSIDIDTHSDFEAAVAMLDQDGKFSPGAIIKKAAAP